MTNSFSKEGNKAIGVCLRYSSGVNEVIIDEEYWNSGISYYRQKIIIFHELGHCLLDRGHKDEKYRGYYKSIMNTFIIRAEDYQEFEEEYYRELFT